jgi:hypothetical protein
MSVILTTHRRAAAPRCLGALAIINGARGKISDFLANDGLWKDNRVIAGSASLCPALEALFSERFRSFNRRDWEG